MDAATGAEAGDRSDAARAEAARLEARLAKARDRLDALLPPELPPSPRADTAPPSPRADAPQLRHPLTSVSSDADISVADHTEVSGCGAPSGCAAPRGGVARIDDDDEIRQLLRPTASRVSRLVELAEAFAEGSLTEESAAEAARAIADEQPFRRSR